MKFTSPHCCVAYNCKAGHSLLTLHQKVLQTKGCLCAVSKAVDGGEHIGTLWSSRSEVGHGATELQHPWGRMVTVHGSLCGVKADHFSPTEWASSGTQNTKNERLFSHWSGMQMSQIKLLATLWSPWSLQKTSLLVLSPHTVAPSDLWSLVLGLPFPISACSLWVLIPSGKFSASWLALTGKPVILGYDLLLLHDK